MSEGELKHGEEKVEPERTSGLMRVAGVSPEIEKKILTAAKETLFDKQKFYGPEREKTTEESQIIDGILAHLPEFVKEYGGQPVPLRPEHVHVIDLNGLTGEEKIARGIKDGTFSHELQAASVITNPVAGNRLSFALMTAHELIHFSAFQSDTGKENKNGPVVLTKRIEGLMVTQKQAGRKEPYFFDLNEAITTELEKRFDGKFFKLIPVLAEDVSEREGFRAEWDRKHPEAEKEAIAHVVVTKKETDEQGKVRKYGGLIGYGYQKQREMLQQKIKEIREKNPGEFESDDAVFNVFAKAYFTGRLLPVARLIEGTYGERSFVKTKKKYGKGSFRRLGEETKPKIIKKN